MYYIFKRPTELENAFGVPAIITRGDRSGKIFKLPWCYFKVYLSRHHDQIYHCLGYYYGDEVPFTVDDVRYQDIYEYVSHYRE